MATLIDRITNRLRHTLFPGPVGAALFRLYGLRKPRFRCPLCGYHGPFMDSIAPWGNRLHSMCPRCGANERGRLQYLVVQELRGRLPFQEMTLIHFSPERALQPHFRQIFCAYRTAGIWSEPVDHPADLTALPFADGSCDCIFASHVLEHIQDDHRALAEIRRVLRPGGVAILPVPIAQERTVEYPAPNPGEAGHVRAPGLDYFDRYRNYFRTVEIWGSSRFPEEFQLFNIEDRTVYPTALSPLRTPTPGERHEDFVPVCIA